MRLFWDLKTLNAPFYTRMKSDLYLVVSIQAEILLGIGPIIGILVNLNLTPLYHSAETVAKGARRVLYWDKE